MQTMKPQESVSSGESRAIRKGDGKGTEGGKGTNEVKKLTKSERERMGEKKGGMMVVTRSRKHSVMLKDAYSIGRLPPAALRVQSVRLPISSIALATS